MSFRFPSRTIQLDFQKGRQTCLSVKEAIFNKRQTQSSQVLLTNEESAEHLSHIPMIIGSNPSTRGQKLREKSYC